MNSKGILEIEPEVVGAHEDDRRLREKYYARQWKEKTKGMTEEERKFAHEFELLRLEIECEKEHRVRKTVEDRIEIFSAVKTYIDLQLDDGDIVNYVSRHYKLTKEEAELEILIAKEFCYLALDES